jgi:hypothetical protein
MVRLRCLETNEIHDFRVRIAEECRQQIARSTVPIFGSQDDKPVENGSGVLFSIADRYFLITAAHVIDFATIHKTPYYLSSGKDGGAFIPMNNVQTATSPIPTTRDRLDRDMRDDDPFDVGVCELPLTIVEQLQPVGFLRMPDVDLSLVHKQACYMVMGYPFAQSESDPVKKTLYSGGFWHIRAFHVCVFGVKLYTAELSI